MFEPLREDGPFLQFAGALLVFWRNRWVRRLLLVGMIGVIAAFGGWFWFWRVTLDDACMAVGVREFNLDELIALRDRKAAYQRSREVPAWLTLSPDEVTFLMSHHRGLSLELAAQGSTLEAFVGYPVVDGCYNMRFRGQARIVEGVLELVPSTFELGGYNLSWMMGGRTIEIRPEDLPASALADQLSNTRALYVESGAIHLRLKDRTMGWTFSDH